ncbi:MAG: hypothetical protein DMG57_39340 [Acidobacteria bacterium]|nr:MAG: hypothetical protein DMG57_39340 [Acidobacteriota bacterium]
MHQLENKIALITGAKGGLGTFVTKAFLAAGAQVAGVSRSIQRSDFPDARFIPIAAELSTADHARAAVNQVLERFQRIDILVHLVGGFAGGKPVAETDDATLEHLLDVNLRSAFYLSRAVIPPMRRAGAGRIIAIGSRLALEPVANVAAYSLSKAALVSLVRTIALENKEAAMTANIILPGTMDTAVNRAADPKADFSTWVHPAQVASLAVWLASGDASDVNGAAIPIYGKAL